MKKADGFTLIEVVASIVIISIILISISQVIIQTKKTAVSNDEKLALIHLADTTLERLKIENYIVTAAIPDETSSEWKNWVENNQCLPIPLDSAPANDLSKITMNNHDYYISACATPQSEDEKNLGLINIRIEVTSSTSKSKGYIEGFVKL